MTNRILEQITNIDDNISKKISTIPNKTLISLLATCCASLLVRTYYLPFEIPISLDGAGYFWYAIDMKILGTFPVNYSYPNTGWPVFLSFFFSVLNSENFLDYMVLQRVLSVVISVLTIPLVFLLCKKFVDIRFALIGTMIFAFDPRIIQNSTSGITESLYVLLGTSTLLLFLSKNNKAVYGSFATLGLLTITRYEGLLLFVPLSIMFFVKFRNDKVIMRYLIAVLIFALIVLPMAYIRTETSGKDGLISHVSAGPEYYQHIAESGSEGKENFNNLLINGGINFIKYFSWIMIPVFWFFVPLGVLTILKKISFERLVVVSCAITMALPAVYAYTRDLHETRYFFILFPIFCILAGYTTKAVSDRINCKFIISVILVIGILFGSLIFLDYKKLDLDEEREFYSLAVKVTKIADGTNDLGYVVKYYSAAGLLDKKFPMLKEQAVKYEPKIILASPFHTLNEYLQYGKDNKLTHLVLDGHDSNEFLNDAYFHEDNYPYLINQFDSKDHGFVHHVKIFKINYDLFDVKDNSRE